MAGELELEGLDKLMENFGKSEKAVSEAAMRGIEKGGMAIVAEAKSNLKNNTSVVTGALRASGKVQKVGDKDLDAGFFGSEKGGYAYYVEYGRRSGKMPPPYQLIEYAHKKMGLAVNLAKSVGWAMAVKIAKRGTRPHPFFAPAIEKMKGKLEEYIRDEVSKV